MSGNRISGADALDSYRKLQARMLLPGYMVGDATGGNVPKGPKPLRYGPRQSGESIAPRTRRIQPTC